MKIRVGVWTLMFLIASGTFAFADEGPTEADTLYQQAKSQWEARQHDEALSSLEQAYRLDADPSYLFLRVLVLEDMGELGLALELFDAHYDEFSAAPDLSDVSIVGERLRTAASASDGSGDKAEAESSVVPMAVGLAGIGLLGVAGYGAFGSSCDVTSKAGDCLRGDEPNWAPIAGYGALGVAGVVTALIWMTRAEDSTDVASFSIGGNYSSLWVRGQF